MQENRSIIAGLGEVGSALLQVLKPHYQVEWHDPGKSAMARPGTSSILHVCIPFYDEFVEEVRRYQLLFNPEYTVIHSTVPVGTSRELGAIHSPIRGRHPDLAEGIVQFVKFLGGEKAGEVADYFRRAGIKVMLCDTPETTEAMKLFDTLYYGVCIEFAKEVKKYCDENGLSFSDVYRLANTSYNEGYAALGYPEYTRPVLEPIMGKIGGHCVIPNALLLDVPLARLLLNADR